MTRSADELVARTIDAMEAARATNSFSVRRIDQMAAAAVRVVVEACAGEIPTNWVDPLLSGEASPNLPYDGLEIEALLRALRGRVRALAPEPPR